MPDVIYVKLDIVYSINHQLNETISRKSYFFETVKSKVIISLFKTVRLSVSISPRNLYNSLKSIKENTLRYECLRYRGLAVISTLLFSPDGKVQGDIAMSLASVRPSINIFVSAQ